MLQLFIVFVGLVFAFLVHLEEAVEFQHAAGGAEQVILAVLALGRDVDGGLVEKRGHHLAGHEAIPDQAIELHLVFGQILLDYFGRKGHRSRTDGFVRILRVLFRFVHVGIRGQELLAVTLGDKIPHFPDGVVGDARGIGAHVGDQTDRAFFADFDAFIQAAAPASWCA